MTPPTVPPGPLARTVAASSKRLARIAGRRALHRHAVTAAAMGALTALGVALGWSRDGLGFERIALTSAAIVTGAALFVALAFAFVGRLRGRQSPLAVARHIDASLGTSEVVASGLEFERARFAEGLYAIAREDAERAVATFDPAAAFPLPALFPGRKQALKIASLLVLGVVLGSYDVHLVQALVDPPRVGEREAAAQLERELEALTASPREGRETQADSERRRTIARRAAEAVRAARRGDRETARRELSALDDEMRSESERAHEMDRSMSDLRRSLAGNKTGTPRESLASLLRREAQELRSPGSDPASLLERLARTRSPAPGTRSEERDARDALARAADALARGDRAEAARALEQAAARAEEMERARAESAQQLAALSRMIDAASALERAVDQAAMGEDGEGGEGNGGRDGAGDRLGQALADRLAALGLGEPGVGRDDGGHVTGTRHPGEGIDPSTSARAETDLSDGPRAVQALRGLGEREEPRETLREVIPAYAAIAEEALFEESIPAARRDAVRRYFEDLRERPQGEESP